MKLTKQCFIILLILSLLCLLSACAPEILEFEDGYCASFVGHMVEINGEYAALTDIYPGENYLELYTDGTGVIAFSGYEEPVTWTNQDSTFTVIFQNEPSVGTLSNGILVLDVEGIPVTYVAKGAQAPVIPTTAPPDYDADLSTPYGNYQGLTISYLNEVLDMAEYYKGPCSIRLDTDGMGILTLGGSNLTIAWELDDDVLTIADTNGVNSVGLLSDGVIVLDYMESGIQLAFAKEGVEP